MADTPEHEEMLEAVKEKAEARKTKDAQEAEEAAAAAEAKAAEAAKEPVNATPEEPQLRRMGGRTAKHNQLYESDIPYPHEQHGEDLEEYGPAGMFASIPDDVEVADYSVDQEFIIDEAAMKTLKFTAPGQNLPGNARLYNIKGIHKDGRLVQLPFEDQIMNTAGGDPEDAIGLRRYQRKGIMVLIDWQTLTPIYCAAWECFAKAEQGGPTPGFCSARHAQHTLPNTYKDSGEILSRMFGGNATTSRTWSIG